MGDLLSVGSGGGGSGTSPAIPKWTATTTLGDSQTADAIGTSDNDIGGLFGIDDFLPDEAL